MSATTVCRTWSLTADKKFTGLCSMQLLLETEVNMKNGCPICVTPIDPETFSGSGSGDPIPEDPPPPEELP